MNTLQNFFSKIYVLNLKRRLDRWKECVVELKSQGIPLAAVTRFEAFDHPTNGHQGCTRSHRMMMKEIAEGPWERALILEDDFAFITKARLREGGWFPNGDVMKAYDMVPDGTIDQRFDYLSNYLPGNWDLLYLGACYGEPPISRHNKHVIRCGLMQTTGSYAVTKEFAQEWSLRVNEAMGSDDLSKHPGPIDNLFGGMAGQFSYYVFQPRLIYQRMSRSDLDLMTNSRLGSCTDTTHENLV